jgi:hypothetical protein
VLELDGSSSIRAELDDSSSIRAGDTRAGDINDIGADGCHRVALPSRRHG